MKFLFVVLFPVFIFASYDDYYVQSFAEHFQKENFVESLEILDYWEASQPIRRNRILGMKAAVYLAKGDLDRSRVLMDEALYEGWA